MKMIKELGNMFMEASGAVVLGSTCESFLKSIEKCYTLDMPVLDRVKSTVENLELWLPMMEAHIMTLGDDEIIKELKIKMKEGRMILDKLSEAIDLIWCKEYNNKLVELDASLTSLVKQLRLQLATLVLVSTNEVLVSTNEATEVGKGTKRKLDQVDETLKQGLKMQESLIRSLINKTEQNERAYKVGALIEDGRLGSAIEALVDEVQKSEFVESGFWRFVRRSVKSMVRERLGRLFGLVEKTSAKNHEEGVNMSGPEVEKYRMSIENGVNLLRNGAKIVEWTDDLKTKYNNEFRDLEKTLDELYNHLVRIRPLQWNCGRCHQSYRTSISVQDCHQVSTS